MVHQAAHWKPRFPPELTGSVFLAPQLAADLLANTPAQGESESVSAERRLMYKTEAKRDKSGKLQAAR